MSTISPFAIGFAAMLLTSISCKRTAPPPPALLPPSPAPGTAFRVTGVEVGKAIGLDKSIAIPSVVFGPRDTVYASIAWVGSGPAAKLRARFIFPTGQLVLEFSESVTAVGPSHAEFHVWRDSGWPVGRYRVEIFVDSLPAGSKEYEVKKD